MQRLVAFSECKKKLKEAKYILSPALPYKKHFGATGGVEVSA